MTTIKRVTYVCFVEVSEVFDFVDPSELEIRQVADRSPERDARDAPEHANTFFYFDRHVTILEVDGEQREMRSDRIDVSEHHSVRLILAEGANA